MATCTGPCADLIAANTAAIGTNTADITANTAAISTNTAEIAGIQSAIGNPPHLYSGHETLDGSGTVTINVGLPVTALVACCYAGMSGAPAGTLIISEGTTTWLVTSSAGSADAGKEIVWIGF